MQDSFEYERGNVVLLHKIVHFIPRKLAAAEYLHLLQAAFAQTIEAYAISRRYGLALRLQEFQQFALQLAELFCAELALEDAALHALA